MLTYMLSNKIMGIKYRLERMGDEEMQEKWVVGRTYIDGNEYVGFGMVRMGVRF